MTLYRTGKLIWPASALNTAAGIALILRVVGTDGNDLWSWRGWYLFALAAALALFTKYAVRYRGTHVFNPSNVALVVIFLMLGSTRVEPLDFWWAPIDNAWMVAAYAIILAGGLFIAFRLGLLPMTLAFWLVLAAGLGLLAASGHCITARWALQPVCGSGFWWVVVLSPEILFFLFFMITDPKTMPAGRTARVVFAIGIAVLCTLLIAPQSTEFGAKVALLAGLALLSPLRALFDRSFPEDRLERSRLGVFVTSLTTSRGAVIGRLRTFGRGAIAGSLIAAIAVLIVVAGTPAREPAQAIPVLEPIEVSVTVDASTLPEVTVALEVSALNSGIAADGAANLALMLAEDLAIEAEAMRRGEAGVLLGADFGPRLGEMQRRIELALATGERVVPSYTFESMHLRVVEAGQVADLGFEAAGVIETIIYDADGVERRRETERFHSLFLISQAGDDRWLILAEREPPD